MNTFRLLIAVSLSFFPFGIHAASFDCKKAASLTEKLICTTPILSDLDEQYAQLYQTVRQRSKSTSPLHKRVKLDARAAFRVREANCKDEQCLTDWYGKGITRLNQQLTMAQFAGVKPTPETLYEKLDLNSFTNALSQYLKYHEKKYFTEVYDKSVVTFTDDTLTIDAEDMHWTIRILDDLTLDVSHRINRASYFTVDVLPIYFDGRDFIVEANTGGFYDVRAQRIEFWGEGNVHCRLLDNQRNRYAQRLQDDASSIGEVLVFVQFDSASLVLFDRPGGNEVGEMRLSQMVNQVGGYDPDIRLCDHNSRRMFKEPVYYRDKDDALLLLYGAKGDWVNVSNNPALPAWFKKSDLPQQLRDKVVIH